MNHSKRLYQTLCAISACVILACAYWLTDEMILKPQRADQSVEEVKKIFDPRDTSEKHPNSSSQASESTQSDRSGFENLEKVNSDIVGWIKIPNAGIDLPVLRAEANDPDFYLNHDCTKNYSQYGSIYSDYRTPVLSENAKCVVLYGHSLLSGRMFTHLDRYKSLDFYKTEPIFTLDTAEGHSEWKVFSVLVTNTLPEQGQPFPYIRANFSSDGDYLNFVYQLRIRSLYNTAVPVNAKDRILLLSTCSYEFNGFREVVAARKVRNGESSSVQTTLAVTNPKVLYPDCWYQKYGGKKPVWPQTYEQALKSGVFFQTEEP